MIRKMHAVSSAFYPAAAATGCHAFIEFCGLQNEFIKVCEQTLAAGKDFTCSNTHGGSVELEVREFNISYFAEKFDCIFGPMLRANPHSREIMERMLELKCDHDWESIMGGNGDFKCTKCNEMSPG